jgi:hypothetical protein
MSEGRLIRLLARDEEGPIVRTETPGNGRLRIAHPKLLAGGKNGTNPGEETNPFVLGVSLRFKTKHFLSPSKAKRNVFCNNTIV